MNSKSSLKKHLLNLEEMLLRPNIRTAPEELSKLLADEFFEYGSSGKVWSKKDCIGKEGLGIVNMNLSNFEMYQLSEDTVLTTYRIFDERKLQHSLRSSIWKFRDERWQMFFHQGTPIM
ncbi:MAG: RNAse [Neobacillus sp.]|jgi:hypothetical protein|nr:RNAse [Neobacillus sp.]